MKDSAAAATAAIFAEVFFFEIKQAKKSISLKVGRKESEEDALIGGGLAQFGSSFFTPQL